MGIGLTEDMINELRDENLEKYEEGINDDVPVYYVDGAPFKNANLKSRLFANQNLRGERIPETINDLERQRMELMASLTEVIYDRRKAHGKNFFSLDDRKSYKDVPHQNVGDYRFVDLESDLTGLFINDNKMEAVLASRGLLPLYDRKDTLQTLPMVRDFLFEKEKPESFGSQFKTDRKKLDNLYRKVKQQYPDHKITATGHSRAGAGSVYLGRKHNIEYHAFSPLGNRADFLDSVPVENGHMYYHTKDPVSYHMHKQKAKTVEQHYELWNTRFYPHSVRDFFDKESVVFKHPKKTLADELGVEEEILLDMRTPNNAVIDPQEYVLSDLGIFDDFERKDYNVFEDPKQQNTKVILGDIPSERGIFNEYISSVYNDLELRPPKPFKPMSFNTLDFDGNGKISFDEFKKYFSKLNYDEETIKQLFETYDYDGDKNMDRQEFNDLIRSL